MAEGGGRPKLNLKPRDPEAAKKAEAERAEKLKASPFGAAKPREQTLASRSGKTEEEILKEAIKSERLRLRLNAQQLQQKQEMEALVEDVKEQLTLESDESKRAELAALVKEKEAAVDELIDKFSHAALEAAQRGEVQRPSERKAMQMAGQDGFMPPYGGGDMYGGGGGHSGGGGYMPTRGHHNNMGGGGHFGGRGDFGGRGGRHGGGGRGRHGGGWGNGGVYDDGYLPGMPPPPGMDPGAVEYESPFQGGGGYDRY